MKIADFGISESCSKKNKDCKSGTPGYRAPEQVQNKDHEASVDYYALGVIAFKCIFRKNPHTSEEAKIRSKLKHGTFGVKVAAESLPVGYSATASDFLTSLLEIVPKKRLGYKGNIDALKQHPWFESFPWCKLSSKALVAPYVPTQKSTNFDSSRAQKQFGDEGSEELIKCQELLK